MDQKFLVKLQLELLRSDLHILTKAVVACVFFPVLYELGAQLQASSHKFWYLVVQVVVYHIYHV